MSIYQKWFDIFDGMEIGDKKIFDFNYVEVENHAKRTDAVESILINSRQHAKYNGYVLKSYHLGNRRYLIKKTEVE